MAYELHPQDPAQFFKRRVGEAAIHVCDNATLAHACSICRLFGSSGSRDFSGSNFPARLLVRDAFFTDYARHTLENSDTGALYTEVKFENVLHRVTAVANPRQIERVLPGSDFAFEVVYTVEEGGTQLAEIWRTCSSSSTYWKMTLWGATVLVALGKSGFTSIPCWRKGWKRIAREAMRG